MTNTLFLFVILALFVESPAQLPPREVARIAALRNAMDANSNAVLATQSSAANAKGVITAIVKATKQANAALKAINTRNDLADIAIAHSQAAATESAKIAVKAKDAIKTINAAATQAKLAVTRINEAARLAEASGTQANNIFSAAIAGK